MLFVYTLVAALFATVLGIAPELQTFDGAACAKKDTTFTNCPKGQGDLLSQKCVGSQMTHETKGGSETVYLKMTSKDPATFDAYLVADCSGKTQGTYKVNSGESTKLIGGQCAEGTWSNAEGKSETLSMKLMACGGPYVPSTTAAPTTAAPTTSMALSVAMSPVVGMVGVLLASS